VTVAGERPQALTQELALEVGTLSKHGPGVRRPELRSFRKIRFRMLVKKAVYVRIRTNLTLGAGGAPEGAGRWSQ
jgi:hypothetical protein